MGEEKPVEWYNAAEKPIAKIDVWKSPYLPIYQEAAREIQKDESVLDLGSGWGKFAKVLQNQDHFPWCYLGVDFSEVNVKIAEEYLPHFDFECRNILSPYVFSLMERFRTIVFIQTLEHIEDDLKIVGNIPKGKNVIITVPSYDSPSHVRRFPMLKDVRRRFEPFIDIKKSVVFFINKQCVFMIKGVAKGEA